MGLFELIAAVDDEEKTLTVFNPEAGVATALREHFADRNLTIERADATAGPKNYAVLSCGDQFLAAIDVSDVLAERARETLDRLGYEIAVRVGDGRDGWPEHAPFDAAYVTCAAAELPDSIPEQTRVGGRILAPIGTDRQTLYRYTRHEDGTVDRESHGGVRFVQMR